MSTESASNYLSAAARPLEIGAPPPSLFRSFWMGGYECACHINPAGERLDMIAAVEHDLQVDHDYALLRSVEMQTARDGLRWHLIERAGQYDFSSFAPMLASAQRHDIQVIWDICHYGWPDGLDIFSPAFVDRFARFAAAVARFVADHSHEVPFYAPINEISFFAWGAARPCIYPFALGRDNELKHQLVRAAIAGCEAIWSVDPRARFVYPEPVMHVVPPRGRPDLAEKAARDRATQFEAWDMLAGRVAPELGGHPKYLDILGANFYYSNQWEIEGNGRLRWEEDPRDDRWVPLHKILLEVYQRYHRPLFISETSHFGVGRAPWIGEIAREVQAARVCGVPLEGICLYPILDRHDWHNVNHWHNSGLWDLSRDCYNPYSRVLNREYATELRACQALLASVYSP